MIKESITGTGKNDNSAFGYNGQENTGVSMRGWEGVEEEAGERY